MSMQVTTTAAGVYTLTKTDDKTGKVKDAEVITATPVMDEKAVGVAIAVTVKTAGNIRNAFCSFLGMLYTSQRLDGFKGTGDKTTGALSKEFKAAVRDVESELVRAMVDHGTLKLPKEKAEGDVEEHKEKQIQTFLTNLRDDKNYSNAKNTTNRYFALVGANCVSQAGFLVPFPVMQAEIAQAVHRETPDNSIAAKLRAVKEAMDKTTMDEADIMGSLAVARDMFATLDGMANEIARKRTELGAKVSPDVAASAVVEKAKRQRATPANRGVKKDEEQAQPA